MKTQTLFSLTVLLVLTLAQAKITQEPDQVLTSVPDHVLDSDLTRSAAAPDDGDDALPPFMAPGVVIHAKEAKYHADDSDGSDPDDSTSRSPHVPAPAYRILNDDGSITDGTEQIPAASDSDATEGTQLRVDPGWTPEEENTSGSESGAGSGVRGPTTHVKVTDTDSYPSRAAIKLYMNFGGSWFHCSGTMIGPRTVLTAAHCIYDAGWATDVWVVPGQTERFWPSDDDGYLGRDLDWPYGFAKWRQMSVWDTSYNSYSDLGVINLDRDLGSRTGWLGYSNRGLPDDVHVRGYPAESPPDNSFDGTFQYYRYIDVDWWGSSSNRMVLNGELCGGDSGSGYYVMDDGSRYVVAVHHGGPTSASNACGTGKEWGTRITGSKFDWIKSKKDGAPTNTARPLMLEYVHDGYVKYLSPTIVDGDDIFTARFTLYNAGFASTGTITVEAWLSTNDYLSASDLKIGTTTLSSLGANTRRTTAWNLRAPKPTSLTTYYVMIVFKSATSQYVYSNDPDWSDFEFLDTLEVGILSVREYEFCGDGIIQGDEECDGGSCCSSTCHFKSAASVCRPAAGPCDEPETCSGSSATCPVLNRYKSSRTVCRASAGPCDEPETCSGFSAFCPANQFKSSHTTCRAAVGDCDEAETCTGVSAWCPANRYKSSHTVCRAASGDCDEAETCTGVSAWCPRDDVKADGTVCRRAVGRCDAAETCDGESKTCPDDEKRDKGKVCRRAAGDCDEPEVCDGESDFCPEDEYKKKGLVCRKAHGECDEAEVCSGESAECPKDEFKSPSTLCRKPSDPDCDEGEYCTGASGLCPPAFDQCKDEPVPGDDCVDAVKVKATELPVKFDLHGATAGEQNIPCVDATGAELWYAVAVPETKTGGTLVIHTCVSDFDSVLAVYTGRCGEEHEELKLIGCNDDSVDHCGIDSEGSAVEVEVPLADGGSHILVRVAGVLDGDEGDVGAWEGRGVLDVEFIPAEDEDDGDGGKDEGSGTGWVGPVSGSWMVAGAAGVACMSAAVLRASGSDKETVGAAGAAGAGAGAGAAAGAAAAKPVFSGVVAGESLPPPSYPTASST